MAAVAFAATARVEKKERIVRLAARTDDSWRRFRPADLHRIKDIVAAMKRDRPLLRRIKQIAQARHRAVMQVRRAQPDAVERRREVAVWVELCHGAGVRCSSL